jgi:hypothetical protein
LANLVAAAAELALVSYLTKRKVRVGGHGNARTTRLFDRDFKRHSDEPAVALCGLNNGLGRQALDQVDFDFVVEVGLGRDHRDFSAIRLHTLPAPRSVSEI